jgi:WD40 repeat protein
MFSARYTKLRASFLAILLVIMMAACGSPSSNQGSTASSTAAKQAATATPTPAVPVISKALLTYKGHSGAVIGVSWSPDGTKIASCSDDGTVQVWDARSGKRSWSYTLPGGKSNLAFAVAWSPDGKEIAAGGQSGTVSILDAATGHQLAQLGSSSSFQIEGIVWSADSKEAAWGNGGDNSVQVWNIAAQKELVSYTGHSDVVFRVAWSPDGKEIASASHDGTVQVWNAATGNHLSTYNLGHSAWSVAWSPDGKYLVAGTGSAGSNYPVSSGNTVKVWNAATGQTILTYKGYSDDTNIYALGWSPNGQYIASGGSDQSVRIWNAKTGQTLEIYKGFTDVVWDVAWSRDGKEIVACSQDGTAQIWQPGV